MNRHTSLAARMNSERGSGAGQRSVLRLDGRRLLGLALASAALLFSGCGSKADDKKPADKPATAAPATPAAPTPAAPAAPAAKPLVSVSLRVKDVPQNAEVDAPKTEVSLVVAEAGKPEQVKVLDTVMGSCSEMSEAGKPPAYNCWFAGAGDNFRVEQKGADIVVFKQEVDEGSAEEPAPELPEKEIARVPLPAGAEVKFAK